MKNYWRAGLLLLLVAATACAACWMSGHFMKGNHAGRDAHAWIHSQLGITAIQDKALEPIEKRYAEQKRHFGEIIKNESAQLAAALLEDRSDSAKVRTAVMRIHEAQGELQNATLQHIFEMKTVLTSEQYEKLIRATATALSAPEK